MRDSLDLLKVALYLSLIVFALAGTRLLVQVTQDEHATAQTAQTTLKDVSTTLTEIRTQTKALAEKAEPVLDESHKAVRQSRALIDVALKTSIENRNAVRDTSNAAYRLLGDASTLVGTLNTQTQIVSAHSLDLIDQARGTLAESSRAMDAAAGLLSDPSIRLTLDNLNHTSANAALMSADAQNKFHLLLFPPKQPWWKRSLNFTETSGKLAWEVLTLKP